MDYGSCTIPTDLVTNKTGFIFAKHSLERSLSLAPKVCKFESETTYDWLNFKV